MNGNDPREEIKELLQASALKEILVRAAALHGHYCPGLAFGVKAGHAGLKRLGFDNTGMEELLAVVECNNCFVDGIQMATGCSLGNNALVYKDYGKTAVTILSRRADTAVRLALKPRAWEGEDADERQKEARGLFQRVVKERQQDPEASKRMKELFRELSFETVEKPGEELFDIRDVAPEFPEYAPIVDSASCSECGEQFMETKASARDSAPVCLPCAKDDCMAVLGRGICVLEKGAYPRQG
jgi:formylmethanofuran dehydrogenase subunit E